MADRYVELFGRVTQVHADDVALITRRRSLPTGTVLDVGCGPGHLTADLCSTVRRPRRGRPAGRAPPGRPRATRRTTAHAALEKTTGRRDVDRDHDGVMDAISALTAVAFTVLPFVLVAYLFRTLATIVEGLRSINVGVQRTAAAVEALAARTAAPPHDG